MSIKLGITYAAIAFVMLGLYPLYLKQIHNVPPMQITLHRIVWSFLTILPVYLWRREWKAFNEPGMLSRWNIMIYIASATSLGGAWFLYVWGVTSGYIIETSLGFFMNPIFSIVLAVTVLREPLRLYQRLTILLAFSGVLVVAIAYGKFPWLGLSIGALLASYGLTKKKSPLNSVSGVTIEIGILFIPGLIALVTIEAQGNGVLRTADAGTIALLVGTGVTTVVPLLFFASAAHLISFTLLGIMQYTGPILTFLVGVFVYNESFSTSKLTGFSLVWLALILFATESALFGRRQKQLETIALGSEIDDTDVESNEPKTPKSNYISEDPSNVV